MAEWLLETEDVIKGYAKFSKFTIYDFNKSLILTTIENCIHSKEWPERFYTLRDEYIPGIIGEEASKFFFWYVFNFGMERLNVIKYKEDDLVFLNYICYNYVKEFIRAKLYNVNPLGFYEIHYSYGSETDRVNTYIIRNDGEKISLKMDSDEILNLIEQTTEYFSMLVENNNISLINTKDSDNPENSTLLLDRIKNIERYIWKIQHKLEEGKNTDEHE